MLKNSISPCTPSLISHNFVSSEDEYDYAQIYKSIAHVLVIPFLLFFISPILSSSYLCLVSLLYATVFRHKNTEFFSVLGVSILLTLLLILS